MTLAVFYWQFCFRDISENPFGAVLDSDLEFKMRHTCELIWVVLRLLFGLQTEEVVRIVDGIVVEKLRESFNIGTVRFGWRKADAGWLKGALMMHGH